MEEYKSPVYNVIAVPVEKVVANTYNPNIVAPPEMKLLELSIWEDGYTGVSKVESLSVPREENVTVKSPFSVETVKPLEKGAKA